MLIEVLNRTEEEAHASGENSSVEGMIGSDTTILLYEVLRVKRLSSEELRELEFTSRNIASILTSCVFSTV